MIQLQWKCPKCNGMNVIPSYSDVLSISPGWEGEDEYDSEDGSVTLKDRCQHC